ncbi:hypothetical protein Tco_0365610 [Tanacetum coccineum]
MFIELLLYQLTNTPYPIDINTPYRSVECQYAVLSLQNTPYCLEEQMRRLDCRIQYVVLGRRFDTSYPTGGYSVSVIFMDTAYGSSQIRRIENWSNAFSCKVFGVDTPYLFSWIWRIGTKMPSEYQQDYKKTHAYASKIYNDPNMSDELRDIYRTLESRYVHEGRTIDPSFYNDLSDDSGLDELKKTLEQIEPYNSRLSAIDDIRNLIYQRIVHERVEKEGKTIHKLSNQIKTNELFSHHRPCEIVIRENVYSAIGNRDHTQAVIALMLYCLENGQPFNLAYFIIKRMYVFRDRKDKVLPYGMILTRLFKNLKANMAEHPFDERYKLVPRKISSLKGKQPKKPPPKRARNVGKSKRPQFTTLSSTESPPSDNEDSPSTKLFPRSYSRALKDDPNMSKEQRETRGMFKNLGRALHNFARMLKKGCRGQILDEFWTLRINEFLKGICKWVMALGELSEIIREVFVKLLLDSFGKLSIRAFMDLFGSKRDRLITVSFMRILRLREVARMTAKIALEFAPEFVYPCRVEEKMTLKEVDGQTVEEIETKIIARMHLSPEFGTISRLLKRLKEEPGNNPRRHDL